MDIFECVDRYFGDNKAHITRLINLEVGGNIAPTTISRIYEGNAKESLTTLVKYALLNVLTQDLIANSDSSECSRRGQDIYIECPNEPELEAKLNEWHESLSKETKASYISMHLGSQALDEYSGLERVVSVMIRDYCHDNKYPLGYEPSFDIYIDANAARFELTRAYLREWLI